MSELTSRDLLFCAPCSKAGRTSVLRLQSVGFLARLRAVSYDCPACGQVTAASLRRGAFKLPRPGACWNCDVAGGDPPPAVCPSCEARPDARSLDPDPAFFTFTAGETAALVDEPAESLVARLVEARQQRRLEDALAAADALTRRSPAEPGPWRRKAELHLEHGFLPSALHLWKKALAHEPEHVPTVLAFASTLELMDELEEALEAAAHAARLAPSDPAPPALQAGLLARLERFPEARVAAERALALDPERADARATLATLLVRDRRYAEAALAWGRVVASDPGNSAAWRYKGLCHLADKEWELARQAGLEAGDGDDEALELVFEALLGAGDLESALAHADRTTTMRPDDTRFLYLRARALMALGRHRDGIATCDAMAAIEPAAEWPKRVRAAFQAKL